MVTTIQIDEKLKSKLDKVKIHFRETYNDIILRLLNNASPSNVGRESLIETIEVLSDPDTMREIAQSLEDYKKGRGKTLDLVEKELGL